MKLEYILLTLSLCVASYVYGINKDKADIRGYYERLYQQQTKLKNKQLEDYVTYITLEANKLLRAQNDKYVAAHNETVNFYEKFAVKAKLAPNFYTNLPPPKTKSYSKNSSSFCFSFLDLITFRGLGCPTRSRAIARTSVFILNFIFFFFILFLSVDDVEDFFKTYAIEPVI